MAMMKRTRILSLATCVFLLSLFSTAATLALTTTQPGRGTRTRTRTRTTTTTTTTSAAAFSYGSRQHHLQRRCADIRHRYHHSNKNQNNLSASLPLRLYVGGGGDEGPRYCFDRLARSQQHADVAMSTTTAMHRRLCRYRQTSLLRMMMMTGESSESSSSSAPGEDKNAGADDAKTATTDDENRRKAAGRKTRVMVGYWFSMLMNIAIAGLFLARPLLPLLSLSTITSIARQCALASYAATGPVLAATISYIMLGAARNDRLTSSTYKRLNINLAQYGALWLLAGGILTTTSSATLAPYIRDNAFALFANPVVIFVSLVKVVNSIKGWGYGVRGGYDQPMKHSKLFASELGDGTKNVATSMFRSLIEPFKNNRWKLINLGYLATTTFVGVLKLIKFAEIVGMLLSSQSSSYSVAKLVLRLVGLAKLSLLTAVQYTLHDAATRDRLTGSTFIQLNWVSAFTFASMAAFRLAAVTTTAARGARTAAVPLSFMAKMVAPPLACAVFCFTTALASIKKKNNKAKQGS